MIESDISTPKNPGAILRIDDCDAHLLEMRWTPDRRANGLVYAHRHPTGGLKEYLHRLIICPPPGLVVDHIDRDGLNNCRANLRAVTQRVNAWNKGAAVNAISQFKGVHPKRGKWAASIRVNGRSHSLGVFAQEVEAATTYDAAALYFGFDGSGLNLPDLDTTPAFRPSIQLPNPYGIPGLRRLSSGTYNIRITRNGRQTSLGYFKTLEDARAAWEREHGTNG